MARWLVKTDPETYTIEDLERDGRTAWDGVRNALAIIHLKAMKPGDSALVYHSGADKALVGLAEIVSEPRPDPTDPSGKSVCPDLRHVRTFARRPTLKEIKAEPKLEGLELIRMSRLSVMPVSEAHWKVLLKMAGEKP